MVEGIGDNKVETRQLGDKSLRVLKKAETEIDIRASSRESQ